ncbi:MAG: hypothetical protein LC777_15545, partial [Actinobacteria bacterium]|nr:hypothetical protein [Actinomycetota bacterium]
GVGRAVGGVFLPIGLALLAVALGAVIALNLRDSSRKVRVGVGVLGVLLVALGVWSLVSKPSLVISTVTPYPQQQVLRSGEPCPSSIDVIVVLRGKGGPDTVGLELSFSGAPKTVPVITPKFELSEMESRQAFGPYQVRLPPNPSRAGVRLLVRTTSPTELSSTPAVIPNKGCRSSR